MPYSLRKVYTLGLTKTHSFYYSTNAVHFRVFVTWNNLLDIAKSSDSFFEFKKRNEIYWKY